jgi:anti-sigma regulatory factor (Ser/Thr protein kinase)
VNVAVERKTFGVSADDVGAIDRWVEGIAAQWGESERTVFRTRVCIAELAANVLEHGIARSGDDRIMVTLQQFGDGIGIEFLDSRGAFDPTANAVAAKASPSKASSIETVSPGGFGLMLVRAYGSDIAYSNDGICNRITLKIKSV